MSWEPTASTKQVSGAIFKIENRIKFYRTFVTVNFVKISVAGKYLEARDALRMVLSASLASRYLPAKVSVMLLLAFSKKAPS